MIKYAPHGDYNIRLDPEHDRILRLSASGFMNLELLQQFNDRANSIIEKFDGVPYGMVCDFNGGIIMTPEAEDAWIRGAMTRVARGWAAVAYHIDETAEYKSLVCEQVNRVFEAVGLSWCKTDGPDEAISWVLHRLQTSAR